ncbi:MAG: hypothetical protein WC587_01090 [Candidatus Paceibacterota bacterium]
MPDIGENFKDFDSAKRSSIRLPKDRYKVKEVSYDNDDDFFVINIDYEDLSEEVSDEQKIPFAQLFGRTMARTRINEDLQSSWTFISAEDFEKTNFQYADNKIFYKIAQKINGFFPPQPLSFVFWQEENGVYCMATENGKEKKILPFLAEKINADIEEKYFISGPFENFSSAEIKMKQALKEVVL